MNARMAGVGALWLAGMTMAVGCGAPKPEPEIASSAPHGGYAERYPADLQAAATSFGDREQMAKKPVGELSGYPDQLKDPKWDQVLDVVEHADASGRSYEYVERMRAVDGSHAFFSSSRDAITKKVAGAAQYVAKQKGCDVDVSGTVSHALKEEVDKQLQEYLRDRSEAHRRIERYRGSLGKANAEALAKQADSIALASYLVHIDLVEQKLRMRRMLEEIEAVRGSMDEALEEERSFQSEKGRTDDEKKAAGERAAALGKSKAMLDSAIEQAKGLDERMEERITAAQKEYREALDRLRGTLREKAGLPPAAAPE